MAKERATVGPDAAERGKSTFFSPQPTPFNYRVKCGGGGGGEITPLVTSSMVEFLVRSPTTLLAAWQAFWLTHCLAKQITLEVVVASNGYPHPPSQGRGGSLKPNLGGP